MFSACSKHDPESSLTKKLSEEDAEALNLLFRHLLQETSFGYVLFEEKPAFTWGILHGHDSVRMLGDSLHRESVYLKKGLRILKNLPINRPSSQFIIIEHPGLYEGWNALWIIHKGHLKKVFEEHKNLFKYVLGPSISAQALLEKLMEPNANFTSILRGDRVLIGIILGYGVENALAVSRYEHLMEYLEDYSVPLKLKRTKNDLSKGLYQTIGDDPSFGYNDIEEEYDQLRNKTATTIDAFPQITLPQLPYFGFLSTPDSEILLKDYQKTQKTIQKQLESPDLLETVLSQFVGKENFDSFVQEKIPSPKTGYLIGQVIWQSLFQGEENGKEVDAFLRGMEERKKGHAKQISNSDYKQLFHNFIEKKKLLISLRILNSQMNFSNA